mgnify:CR=1 FL=1
MAILNPHNVFQTLAVESGRQPDYVLSDSRRIRNALNRLYTGLDILVSDNDARLFWEWRSEHEDATWHTIPEDPEALTRQVEYWFQRWIDNGCDPQTDDISY